MAIPAVEPKVIYLVERLPPPPQQQDSPILDKIRYVAAPTLVILGLVMLFGAALALGGHLIGYLTISAETVQMLFMTSIVSIISGFHLTKGVVPFSAEIASGPLAITI